MLVNNSIAGSLIGPKGAIVKEMKEETGCKVIKVNSDDVPGSTDKIVVILGEKDSVVKAVGSILEKLEGQDIKGRERRLEYVARGRGGLQMNQARGGGNMNQMNPMNMNQMMNQQM